MSKWFQRFARKEGIADAALQEAAARADKGQIDAELGSSNGLLERGQGRSGGYRTIILFWRGTKAFFVYGFPKSQRANIDADELKQFREAAKHVLALTEKQLAELLKRGDFLEVKENGQEIPK